MSIASFFIGAVVGIIVMCIIFMARSPDEVEDRLRLDFLTEKSANLASMNDSGQTYWSVVKDHRVVGWLSKSPREAIDSAMLTSIALKSEVNNG